MNWRRLEVFLEFLVFGVVFGIVEDLIAINVATREPITFKVVGVVILVAIPFAILGEVLVDQVDFVEIWKKLFCKKTKENETLEDGYQQE